MSTKVNLTPQRKAILDVILSSHDHPTAADIITRLTEQGHHFAYGTVYNSLRYLTESHLVLELKLGDAASRYDGNTADHHHIQCTICGRVDEVVTQVPVSWTSQIQQETHYDIESTQVLLKGVCPTCQQGKITS
jgi:Fur family peroxide stress response transcriptional regulator